TPRRATPRPPTPTRGTGTTLVRRTKNVTRFSHVGPRKNAARSWTRTSRRGLSLQTRRRLRWPQARWPYMPTDADYMQVYDPTFQYSIPQCGSAKPFSGAAANKQCVWDSKFNAFVLSASSTLYEKVDPRILPKGWIFKRNIKGINVRGAVRSYALTRLTLEGRQGPTADAPAGGNLHAAPFGKNFTHIPIIELSITIVITKDDVPKDWLEGFERFGRGHLVSFIAVLERGDKKGHMHIQATTRVHALHGQMDVFKSYMVDYLTGFTVQKSTKVQAKPLVGTQTFLGTIGYVLKVENQPSNFGGYVCSDDVTPPIILAAKKEFRHMRADQIHFPTCTRRPPTTLAD
ncbi:hypothetical protein M885DRAFT_534525, partial [Pelagophyceae sp. CCMP2097]